MDPADAETILEQIEDLFTELEIEGRKVIRDVYRKEDIYTGPYIESAPDLILVAESGFNLKGKIGSDSLYSKGIFTGKHTQDTAFVLLKGPYDPAKLPQVPKLSDISHLMS